MPKGCSPSKTIGEGASTAEKRYLAPQAVAYSLHDARKSLATLTCERMKWERVSEGVERMTRPGRHMPRQQESNS